MSLQSTVTVTLGVLSIMYNTDTHYERRNQS